MAVVDLQAEFFVPLDMAQLSIRGFWATAKQWTFSSPWGSLQPPVKGLIDAVEFRQVRGDGSWLSPQPHDSLGIHISFNGDPARRQEALQAIAEIEKTLEPFGARAHWGKLATISCTPLKIAELYSGKLEKFRDLCEVHDPTGKFRNTHVSSMLFTSKANKSAAGSL